MIFAAIEHVGVNSEVVWKFGASVLVVGLVGVMLVAGITAIGRFLDH